MIKLDDNYTIRVDSHSFALQYSYEDLVEEKKKDPETNKFVKTGKKVNKEFFDYWYYPTIKMCIEEYMKQTLKKSVYLDTAIKHLDSIEKTLGDLPSIYVKNGKLVQL